MQVVMAELEAQRGLKGRGQANTHRTQILFRAKRPTWRDPFKAGAIYVPRI